MSFVIITVKNKDECETVLMQEVETIQGQHQTLWKNAILLFDSASTNSYITKMIVLPKRDS